MTNEAISNPNKPVLPVPYLSVLDFQNRVEQRRQAISSGEANSVHYALSDAANMEPLCLLTALAYEQPQFTPQDLLLEHAFAAGIALSDKESSLDIDAASTLWACAPESGFIPADERDDFIATMALLHMPRDFFVPGSEQQKGFYLDSPLQYNGPRTIAQMLWLSTQMSDIDKARALRGQIRCVLEDRATLTAQDIPPLDRRYFSMGRRNFGQPYSPDEVVNLLNEDLNTFDKVVTWIEGTGTDQFKREMAIYMFGGQASFSPTTVECLDLFTDLDKQVRSTSLRTMGLKYKYIRKSITEEGRDTARDARMHMINPARFHINLEDYADD